MSDEPSGIEAALELVEQEEGPRRRLTGPVGIAVSAVAVLTSVLFLYWAWGTVTAQILRLVFLALTLGLSFLLYPARRKGGMDRISPIDVLLVALTIAAVG